MPSTARSSPTDLPQYERPPDDKSGGLSRSLSSPPGLHGGASFTTWLRWPTASAARSVPTRRFHHRRFDLVGRNYPCRSLPSRDHNLIYSPASRSRSVAVDSRGQPRLGIWFRYLLCLISRTALQAVCPESKPRCEWGSQRGWASERGMEMGIPRVPSHYSARLFPSGLPDCCGLPCGSLTSPHWRNPLRFMHIG